MRAIMNGILDMIYPPVCQNCELEISSHQACLCIACNDSLPFISKLHGYTHEIVSMRMNNLIPLQYAYSCFYSSENNIVQKLIKSFKYNKNIFIGEFLSKRMAEDFKDYCQINDCSFDLIIPVPIHRHKKRKRGYNQSEIISDILSARLGVEVDKDILIKVGTTDSQTKKTRFLRMNMKEDTFKTKKHATISQQHVLIIDDILTTGSTLEKCVNLLRTQFPEAKFSIATLALSVF